MLSEDECRRLLALAGASGEVGRLAMNREGSPHLVPLNFSVCGDDILVRLGPGFAAYHLEGDTVAFEIDHSESHSRKGWSVLAEGTARVLTYDEVAQLGRNIPHPTVMEPGMRVFAIRLEKMSGRSLIHDYQDVDPAPSAVWPDRYHESKPGPALPGRPEPPSAAPPPGE
jgi:hypothetical protein